MKALFACSLFAALAVLPPLLSAQVIPPPSADQVQVAEVLRLGDTITSAGEGPRDGGEVAFKTAMSTPVDDSLCWFVHVWTIPDCKACEALKSDFRKAPELLAFVAPQSKDSLQWAHYIEYSGADETQKDRRTKYGIRTYPTIIIQPPRARAADGDGVWGDPGNVVGVITGYRDAKDLAKKMTAKVDFYSKTMGKKGYPKQPATVQASVRSAAVAVGGAGQAPSSGEITAGGTTPPVPAPPPVLPYIPTPSPQPSWPPTPETPAAEPDLLSLLTPLLGPLFKAIIPSGMTTGVWLLVGLKVWELVAKRTKTKLDDQAVAFFQSVLSGQTPAPLQPPAPSANALAPSSSSSRI